MRGRDLGFGLGSRSDGLAAELAAQSARWPRFTPRGRTPRERVEAFIADARNTPCWLAETDFDAAEWDVTDLAAEGPGRPHDGGTKRIGFHRPRGCRQEAQPMPPCIRDFAAAVIRQTPRVRIDVMRRRRDACGYIGEALEARGLDSVAACDPAVFDDAVRRASARLGEGAAAAIGAQLRLIARFLAKAGMTGAPIGDWEPSLGYPSQHADAEARAALAAKRLPATGFIADTGRAFGAAERAVDVVVSSVLALQCCTLGGRNFAVLNLAEDCDFGLDDGTALSLRWVGSKRRGPEVTDVPAELAATAREALRLVRKVTAPARAAKLAYAADPSRLYLPPDLAHLREREWLTMAEAEAIVGFRPRRGLYHHLRCKEVRLLPTRTPRGMRGWLVNFADLERRYLERLPARMRAAGGEDYLPLFVLPEDSFRRVDLENGLGSPVMFKAVTPQQIRNHINPSPGTPGLWGRTGIDRSGSHHRTHSIRHLFTTLGCARGVAEDDINEAQRRAISTQIRDYKHLPEAIGDPVLAATADALASGGSSVPVVTMATGGSLANHSDDLMRAQGLRVEPADHGTAEEDDAA